MNAGLTTLWRGVKTFGVWLSALCCVAAMVAWGFGMAWRGFYFFLPPTGNIQFAAGGFRGGLVLVLLDVKKLGAFSNNREFEGTIINLHEHEGFVAAKRVFVIPQFDPLGLGELVGVHTVLLPYWLLTLLTAYAPVVRLRRRYVKRRDEKLFEEVKAKKLAEQAERLKDEL